MSVSIIINPRSGRAPIDAGRRRAECARQILSRLAEEGTVSVTNAPGHARDLAREAVRRGDRLVIAWGGDGTVNEVASLLAFGPIPLAIVPTGSGNGLARSLGVDARPDHAIAQALGASPQTIDAGELGGRLFFSIAGLGFDAHVAACFAEAGSGHRGFSTYVQLVARELRTYPCRDYQLDGQEVRRAMLVTFTNSGQFGNGARIVPRARMDDGLLDLVVFEEVSRLATAFAVARLFLGGVDRVRGVTVRQVTHAVVEGERPLEFHVDGEPMKGDSRLEARVHPSALRVCVR